MNLENSPVCNQTLCLFRECTYCTKDLHNITPNSKFCKCYTVGSMFEK